MVNRHKIVVAGAGILGASIAYHLCRRGAQVTLIDQAGPAAAATGASWAWLNASHRNPRHYFELRYLAMREYHRLERELCGKLAIDWCGSLLWEMDRPQIEQFVKEHASWGYDVQLMGPETIKDMERDLRIYPEAAAYAPCEGALDPVQATRGSDRCCL